MSARFDINAFKIASPCPARWEDMSGDERARFCRHCQKHVYNLSTMTPKEVEALVQEKEGNLCGRLFRRKDGTVMTANCPAGQTIVNRKRRQWVAGITAGFALLATTLWVRATNREEQNGPGRLTRELEHRWYDLKVQMGWERPVILAGEIAVPVTPQPTVNRVTPALPAPSPSRHKPVP